MNRRAPLLALALSVLFVACAERAGTSPTTVEPEEPLVDSTGRVIEPAPVLRAPGTKLVYPATPTENVIDVLHGVEVADPYRWMEDVDSPRMAEWIAAENEVTFAHLATIPERPKLRRRLEELWNYERNSAPILRGERLFFTRNDGLENQAKLYVANSVFDEPRVLLDPNQLSEDGTVALREFVPNPEGTLVAYSISDGGSDWRTWRFLDVSTGINLADTITRNKFGRLEWAEDGVVYERYARPEGDAELRDVNRPHEICMHLMGASQADDIVLVQAPEEGRRNSATVTASGRAIVVTTRDVAASRDEVHVVSLAEVSFGYDAKLATGFDAQYSFIGNHSNRLWFVTDLEAPKRKVLEIDLENSDREHWKVLVPEANEAIVGASTVGGRLIVRYLRDATSLVRLFELDGTLARTLELPRLGTANGFEGELEDEFTYFTYESFATPSEVWRLHPASGELTPFRKPKIDFDPADFVTRQVFFESRDGTSVPMFLVHRRGLKLNGSNQTLLYGYGGFDISLTPRFSVANLVWIERGGVYAMPNLRGGGEYGETWHQAGTKLEKQNVFDDFIAAAEWLIANKYTRRDRLGISGGSNGGLLVGACMTQRPELFGACLPAVGVMDMLRYHLFTIGWAWAGDYGTVDDADEFRALLAYSPYHALREGVSYPATLVTTAARDDRVVPAHSFKFAARLQACQAGDAPVLLRVETRAGHGAGTPTAMRIDLAADQLAFLASALR